MVIRRNSTNKKNARWLKTATIDTNNTNDLSARIQEKAYRLFEKRGYSHGNDWSDWLEAERLVKKELGIR